MSNLFNIIHVPGLKKGEAFIANEFPPPIKSVHHESTGKTNWVLEEPRSVVKIKGLNRDVKEGEVVNKEDLVNHPAHYAEGREHEPIDVIEDWQLPYHLANALKYLSRYDRKGNGKQDLEKAVWYINRYIEFKYSEEK